MSATAQTNGKKSSNSSIVNTPASTPVTNGNSQTISQSTPPPPNNNAPKYGTLVPNRIFVGGISANTTEGELLQLFSSYGTVKAAKIIQDRAGVSKGYGFITFESEDDAKRPLKDADNIVLKERKLNIAPAIKKQPFNRAFDAASPSTVAPGNTAQYFFPPSPGVPYFQGGVTYYQQPPAAPGDPNSQTTVYQAPPVYPAQTGQPQAPTYPPMMFPHHIYMPQQYAMPPMPYDYNYYPNNGGGAQYMVGGQNGGPGGGGSGGNSQGGPPMPPPNSPPRPPCYNAQLPPYTPDPVYYNMPVYGGPVEGAPLYPEGLDMSNGVGYPEVSQLLGEFLHGFDGCTDIHQGPYPMADPTQDINDSAPPPLPPPIATPLTADHAPLYEHETNDADNSRQSKTPVVSLLSMEQHQEKDFVSMQGGRRVKPQPPPPPPPQQQPMIIPHFAQNQAPPPIYYNFNGPPVRSHQIPPYNNNNIKTTNGYRKPRTFNSASANRANDNSSRSSLRTDSNSSANAAVDENKNEDKQSPNSFHLYNGSRTYQNSLGRRINNNKKDTALDNNNKTKSNFVVQSQQQLRNNGQQSYVLTSASAASVVRRNKRSTRRNVGQSGGSLSEIGAGDAPLANNDVTDTCKKMETLKM
ncbi:boule [Tribolium castaneum]|uniref:Boule n=1 Tax=Tribolium castaneum TaxID=7070 RepID=D2A636_TRICA|nr:PREDICTED: atrophin-1 isoform X1 [Tribolium castaneum]XP_008194819.1 PREDICTED: atrophin-1 isoform X1 [Tribolium castaneum]EFA05679.2 boule [Tribolium castaneum]|eukprot:XP_008194818.1 PREDICTED: atrophin-1 isoform X1 [Tribolium castaneum]